MSDIPTIKLRNGHEHARDGEGLPRGWWWDSDPEWNGVDRCATRMRARRGGSIQRGVGEDSGEARLSFRRRCKTGCEHH